MARARRQRDRATHAVAEQHDRHARDGRIARERDQLCRGRRPRCRSGRSAPAGPPSARGRDGRARTPHSPRRPAGRRRGHSARCARRRRGRSPRPPAAIAVREPALPVDLDRRRRRPATALAVPRSHGLLGPRDDDGVLVAASRARRRTRPARCRRRSRARGSRAGGRRRRSPGSSVSSCSRRSPHLTRSVPDEHVDRALAALVVVRPRLAPGGTRNTRHVDVVRARGRLGDLGAADDAARHLAIRTRLDDLHRATLMARVYI